jgi:hypothetical protein
MVTTESVIGMYSMAHLAVSCDTYLAGYDHKKASPLFLGCALCAAAQDLHSISKST